MLNTDVKKNYKFSNGLGQCTLFIQVQNFNELAQWGSLFKKKKRYDFIQYFGSSQVPNKQDVVTCLRFSFHFYRISENRITTNDLSPKQFIDGVDDIQGGIRRVRWVTPTNAHLLIICTVQVYKFHKMPTNYSIKHVTLQRY